MLDRPGEALPLLKKRFAQFDERQIASAFEDIRKITPRSLLVTKAGLGNAELFNVEAGLLKPDEKLKSYDRLFTDEFVK
jgi:NitT/TauT family transport system substrate-binding protein